MYIKFCRIGEADTKLPDESRKLQDLQRRAHVYRGVSVILSVLSLLLAAAVIILCVKLQTRAVCLEKDIQGERVPIPRSCRPQECRQFCPREKTKVHPCSKCDSGWQQFEGSCFYLSRDHCTWAKCKEECRKKAGDLAIIDNKRLQEFLTKKGNLAYWIGLSRTESEEFVWVNNATVGENYWASSQREGNCGYLIGGDPPDRSWSSSPCSHQTAYICQKDA
ncbi:hypothetical protein AAFF_G00070760 [Aldrovandia affinis]|uniref:C-type lectin domain-containing protein n=1 Tax=Aldrovandia affinis TaxID=143900 RepID=A0AAD7RZ56_9TELE|nr:hypothetical protein AAFF_G00070760 [Aldrovandia affinis]